MNKQEYCLFQRHAFLSIYCPRVYYFSEKSYTEQWKQIVEEINEKWRNYKINGKKNDFINDLIKECVPILTNHTLNIVSNNPFLVRYADEAIKQLGLPTEMDRIPKTSKILQRGIYIFLFKMVEKIIKDYEKEKNKVI